MPRFSLPSVLSRGADSSVGTEAFRVVRTNLELALLELEPATIMVTSAHAGEGKTSTCAQLARSFAEAGRRVVAVDLDLRQPDLHNWFEVANVPGASDVLTESCRLDEAVRFVEVASAAGTRTHALNVLTAGAPVPNATELLGTERMERLLEALSRQADLVLIDTPPVLPVADSLVIARLVGGVVLVIDDDTPLESSRAVKEALMRNQARVLGVVLNRFESHGLGKYGYELPPPTREE